MVPIGNTALQVAPSADTADSDTVPWRPLRATVKIAFRAGRCFGSVKITGLTEQALEQRQAASWRRAQSLVRWEILHTLNPLR